MRNRRSIIWLLLGILLLAVANFMLSRTDLRKATIVPRTSLLTVPDDEVSLLEISREGSVECVLTKTGSWRIVAPFSGAADETAVLRLVDAIACAPIEDDLGDKELLKLGRTREDFLLAPPRITVRLKSGERETSVGFGALTPSNAGVYSCVDGVSSVFIVPSNTLSAVDIPTSAFRQRAIFSSGEESVSAFDLKTSSEFTSFRRNGEGWLLTQPTEGQAAATKVRKLLEDICAARAVDFVWPLGTTNEVSEISSALLAGYGLDAENAVTVSMKGVDGAERRISFGREASDGLVYALIHSGTAIVTVDRALRDAASLGNAVYADTRLFPYEASQVTSVTLVDDGVQCLLAKHEDGTWRMDSPVAAEAESAAVSALVDAVLAVRSADCDESGVEVSVPLSDHKVKVARSSLGRDFSLEGLRSLDIQRIDPATVRRITVTGTDTNKTTAIAFDKDRGTWNVESSSTAGTVRTEVVEKVLSELNPLRASRIVKLKVSASDLSVYGLDTPRLTLAVDLEREDSIRRNILVGERAEGGYYATVGSSDAVFVLPYRVFEVFSQEFVGE